MKKKIVISFLVFLSLRVFSQQEVSKDVFVSQDRNVMMIASLSGPTTFWNLQTNIWIDGGKDFWQRLYPQTDTRREKAVFSPDFGILYINTPGFATWNKPKNPQGAYKKITHDWETYVETSIAAKGYHYINNGIKTASYLDSNYTLGITSSGKMIVSDAHFKKGKLVKLNGLVIKDALSGIIEQQVFTEAEVIYDKDNDGTIDYKGFQTFLNNNGDKLVTYRPRKSNMDEMVSIYDLKNKRVIHPKMTQYINYAQMGNDFILCTLSGAHYLTDNLFIELSTGKTFLVTIPNSLLSRVRAHEGWNDGDTTTTIYYGKTYFVDDKVYHINNRKGKVSMYQVLNGELAPVKQYDMAPMKLKLNERQNFDWCIMTGNRLVAIPLNRNYIEGGADKIWVFNLEDGTVINSHKYLEPYAEAPPLSLASPNLSVFQKENLRKTCEDEITKLPYSLGSALNYPGESTEGEFNFILVGYDCVTKECQILYNNKSGGDLFRTNMKISVLKTCSLNAKYHTCTACDGSGRVSTTYTTGGYWSQWDTHIGFLYTRKYIPETEKTNVSTCSLCKGKGYLKNN